MKAVDQFDQDGVAASVQFAPDERGRESVPPTRYLFRLLLMIALIPSIYQWLVHVVIAFTPGTNGIYDLSVYYAAALALRDNAHANIYNPDVLRAAASAHGAFLMPVATLYLYPPLLAILTIPLTLMSLTSAAHVWVVCNLLMWLAATALLASLFRSILAPQIDSTSSASLNRGQPAAGRLRAGMAAVISWAEHVPDVTVFAFAVTFALSLSNASLEESVVIGQVSLLIFFLLVLAVWLERRGQSEMAGGVLAFAALIKVFPLVLIGYYVLRGNWRLVRGAAICAIVLLIGMTLYVGVPGVLATRAIFSNAASSATQYQNESLARLPFWLGILAGRELHHVALYSGYLLIVAVLIAFMAGVAFLTLSSRRRSGMQANRVMAAHRVSDDALGYAWALATMVLVSPVTWEHHLAWLLPACLFSMGYTLRLLSGEWRQDPGRFKVGLMVLGLLIIGYVFVSNDLPFGYDGLVPLSPGPYIIHNIPIRPFFMIERPIGGLLIWLASGILYLRAYLPGVRGARYQGVESPTN